MNMKFFGAAGVTVSVLATLWACSGSEATSGSLSLDQEEAALVAAVAASEDATEDSSSALGVEPFWVKGCGFGAIRQQIRERFDTDGDGRLGAEERAAIADEFGSPVDRVALLLELYDADESGALDATELGALQGDVEARCAGREAALIARFDTDGDGELSDAERQAAREALEHRFGRGRGHERGDAGADDGDGESPRERRERAAGRFDRDGDGRLNRGERRAFGEHLRGCVRGEHPVDDPVDPGDDEPAADAGPSN
jgi:Ca2+-binding EF-hand superfamily protein